MILIICGRTVFDRLLQSINLYAELPCCLETCRTGLHERPMSGCVCSCTCTTHTPSTSAPSIPGYYSRKLTRSPASNNVKGTIREGHLPFISPSQDIGEFHAQPPACEPSPSI